MTRSVIQFGSLFFVALATGGAFVVYRLYNPAAAGPVSWVALLQLGIRNLIPLAVALNLGLLFTLIATFSHGAMAKASPCSSRQAVPHFLRARHDVRQLADHQSNRHMEHHGSAA